MDWSTLVAWFEKIPPTFWGVLAGSGFTLFGVILTNRAHDRRLERQLTHHREIKSEERELSLRKEIYLAAAEAISAGMTAVGRLADLNIPQEKLLEAWVEKAPAIAKANIVAQEDTAEALAKFNATLGATVFRLLGIRLRLTAKMQQAAFLMQSVEQHSAERDRMLQLFTDVPSAGVEPC